ncbi:hypothetical protein BW721_11525 [Jeotgalibaca sp. PTS2502]|uniref:prepilin-type N-terminal cleavage/methylation domain-containing protein n=1 Tax=Jeotgalibaca sp. PTS2502 TaxID=1903686 RepID=UPI0009737CFB|nr:prepilin-type N-terminal cleavage/methylation domain-containing protein [Jeotgalibaca sp. PTS2502]APZ50199.1 hypothetical protein BW721_11525 [Jeotgalibaca sp. PTS2502]
MRNRIKQLLNKEEGFTLVELLGVIVILAIILAIAVPGIGKVIENAEVKTEENQKELVLDAAQLYFLQIKDDDNKVTVSDLEENGFLEKKEERKEYEVTKVKDTETGKETFTITPD